METRLGKNTLLSTKKGARSPPGSVTSLLALDLWAFLFPFWLSSFRLSNTGNVALEYTWMEDMGDERAASRAGELLLATLEGKALALRGSWGCPVCFSHLKLDLMLPLRDEAV